MRHKFTHPMLSDEFLVDLDRVIEQSALIEEYRDRYFRRSIYEEQKKHKITYTNKQLKKLRAIRYKA